MKKIICVVLVTMGMLSLTACVSKKDYEAVVQENTELTQKVSELESDIAGLQEKTVELTNENSLLEENLKASEKIAEGLNTACEELKIENESLQTTLEEVKNSKKIDKNKINEKLDSAKAKSAEISKNVVENTSSAIDSLSESAEGAMDSVSNATTGLWDSIKGTFGN